MNVRVVALSLVSVAAVGLALREGPALMRDASERLSTRISGMMRLDEVVWEEVGSTNLSERVAKDRLWSASGLAPGMEVLPLNLQALEAKLLSIPWIESVQIQKKLPSTLVVRYTTHQARALALRKNRLWLISSTGKWIASLPGREAPGGANMDLPVLASEQTVPMELRWLDALEAELDLQYFLINEVDYTGEKMTALTELKYPSQAVKAALVALGPPSPETLIRLKRVLQYLFKNNILVSRIDLRAGKKVVVNVGKRP